MSISSEAMHICKDATLQADSAIDYSSLVDGSILPILPLPLTNLVGRSAEIALLADRLQQPNERLITVTGEPGVGKTRVLIEALDRIANDDERIHIYLSIEETPAASNLVQHIAVAVCSVCRITPATMGAVAESLGEQRVLVFVDSIEPFIAEAPLFVDLLRFIPQLTLLIGSRLPLHVRGERIIRIPPFAVPETGSSIAAIERLESVQLLVDRIRAFEPDFALSPQNLADAIEVSIRLEGIPLLIELAASRILLLSLSAIRVRIPEMLDLLSDGAVDLPPRSRSARASIRWTYNLLDSAHQRALRTLCVFEQSFSLNLGAELLSANEANGITREEAINQIAYLSAAALITPSDGEPDAGRMRIRWHVQLFGREELTANGETERVYGQLLKAYADWLMPLLRRDRGEYEQALFRELDHEYIDIANVNTFAAASPETARIVLPMATLLWPYWNTRGLLEQGHSQLLQLYEAADHDDAAMQANALHAMGNMELELQHDDDARLHFEQALELRRLIGDADGMAMTLNNMGVLAVNQGRIAEAKEYYRQSAATIPNERTALYAIVALCNLGEVLLAEGENEEAESHFQRAFDYAYEHRQRRLMVNAMSHLMLVSEIRNNETGRSEWYESGLEVAETILDRHGESRLRMLHSRFLASNGRTLDALREVTRGLQAAIDSGSVRMMRSAAVVLAEFCVRHGLYQFAAQALGAADRSTAGMNVAIGKVDIEIREALEEKIRDEIGGPGFIRAVVIGMRLQIAQTLETGIALLTRELDELEQSLEPQQPTSPLTNRELEVLECIARGFTDKQIADSLNISPRTSMTHVGNVMKKLEVNNRSAAASKGIRLGLIKQN